MTQRAKTPEGQRSTLVGWTWVAGQVVLLGVLIVLPGSTHWQRPTWVMTVAAVLIGLGLVTVGAASLRLGTALTPTPVPTSNGTLVTGGLYRFVRHPIYTGVLAIVAGLVLRSGSWLHVAVGVVTWWFFDRKAAWEERRLAEHYPGYGDYAAQTPKFIPFVRRRSSRP